MAIYTRRGLNSPTNDCINQRTPPEDLVKGPACERERSGNTPPDLSVDGYDGYDGYVSFTPEGLHPTGPASLRCPPGSEFTGYHKFSVTEFLAGASVDGQCVSPYSRFALGRGISTALTNREEQLLRATGKPVLLLRRQFTGVVCLCESLNRGRGRKKCNVCFGTGFVPGYIPYIYDKEPLGRIFVRFEPYTEDNPLREQGVFQEVPVNAWTLSFPQIRKRDVIVVYNKDGTEEFRYEVLNVTRNETFQGATGAQKFAIKRIDPNDIIYRYDPFAIPDLQDIRVDVCDVGPLYSDRAYDRLSIEDDGIYPNVFIENAFGDGAFSAMFTEGYKEGYELNFRRVLNFQQPVFTPDFDQNGFVDDAYGPVFRSSSGRIIHFSTPQEVADNVGIDPTEVLIAEKKKNFLEGWISGAKHGMQDATNELRARGLLT